MTSQDTLAPTTGCDSVDHVRALDLLGFAWTLPNTLLGLLLGLLTFQLPRAHGGAIVFDHVPRGLTRILLASTAPR
jgi:hypothetical protein